MSGTHRLLNKLFLFFFKQMSPFLLRTDSNFAVFFTDEVSPFHCQTGGLQKLTFHSVGKKVVIRTLLMARPVPCHSQEAGPRAPGPCPPTGPQERTKPRENTPSVPRLPAVQGGLV